jgi:hypothetical protein
VQVGFHRLHLLPLQVRQKFRLKMLKDQYQQTSNGRRTYLPHSQIVRDTLSLLGMLIKQEKRLMSIGMIMKELCNKQMLKIKHQDHLSLNLVQLTTVMMKISMMSTMLISMKIIL